MARVYKNSKSKPNNRKTNTGKGMKEYQIKRSSNKYSSDDKFDPDKATNDPSWYALDPALLRDAASLPFSRAVGTPLSLHNPALQAFTNQEFTIPGIMEFKVTPNFGFVEDAYAPLNTAAFGVYTFVRHQNSGHANYDAPDLMLYLCAMTQVYSYINFLQRCYGVVTTFAQKNRYLPQVLLRTMGVNYDSLRTNLAQFRYGINALINKAASLCVPSIMPIFMRMATIYTNVYIEGDTMKDQLYLYNPQGFYKYTLDENSAGKLEFVNFVDDSRLRDYSELIEFGNDMLARLVMSEDLNIMSGDILKAYGSGSLIKLAPLPEYYNIVPIADVAVLNQMKNSTPIDFSDIRISSMDVIQDPSKGWLIHKPVLAMEYDGEGWLENGYAHLYQTLLEDKLLTIKSSDPTPAEVMEYTRGMLFGHDYERDRSAGRMTMYIDAACDIISNCRFWQLERTSSGDWEPKYTTANYVFAYNAENVDDVAKVMRTLAEVANFRFHPACRVIGVRMGDAPGAFQFTKAYTCFDLDNYTTIDVDTARSINETALLSLFAVPTLTKSK